MYTQKINIHSFRNEFERIPFIVMVVLLKFYIQV